MANTFVNTGINLISGTNPNYITNDGITSVSTYGKTYNYISYDNKSNPYYSDKFHQVEKQLANLTANWYKTFDTYAKREEELEVITRYVNIYYTSRYLHTPAKNNTYDFIKINKLN